MALSRRAYSSNRALAPVGGYPQPVDGSCSVKDELFCAVLKLGTNCLNALYALSWPTIRPLVLVGSRRNLSLEKFHSGPYVGGDGYAEEVKIPHARTITMTRDGQTLTSDHDPASG